MKRVFALGCLLVVVGVAVPGAASHKRIEGPVGDPTCFDRRDNDRDGFVDGMDTDCMHVDYIVFGTAFQDDNANGVRDSGELPLSGWRIHLIRQYDWDLHLTTDGAGNYFHFVGLGDYMICLELPPDWTQTSPSTGVDCSAHATGAAPNGYAVAVGVTSPPDFDEGWSFGNRLARCAGSGAGGGPTVANQLFGTEDHDGEASSLVADVGRIAPADAQPAVREAACGVAAAEDLIAAG